MSKLNIKVNNTQHVARKLTQKITGQYPQKLREYKLINKQPKLRPLYVVQFDILQAIQLILQTPTYTLVAMAQHFKMDKHRVARLIQKHGYKHFTDFKKYHLTTKLPLPKIQEPEQLIYGANPKYFDIDKAIELVTYQIPAVGICQHFGISMTTLINRLKQHGYDNFTDFKQHHNMKQINDIRMNLFKIANNEKHFPALKLLANTYTQITDNNSSKGNNNNNKQMPKIYYLDQQINQAFIKLDLKQDQRAIVLKEEHFLKHQWKFIKDDTTKYLCLLAGFGGGKTHIFLRKTLIAHMTQLCTNGDNVGKSDGIIIYPTLKMGKALFWDNFIALLEQTGIPYKKNIAQLTIQTTYGIIRLLSGQNPQRLVGYNSSFVGIDELDTIRRGQQIWDKANARLRGKQNAQLFTTSTPEGFGLLYKKFVKQPQQKIQKGQQNYTKIIRAKTTDNPFLPQDFITSLKDQFTDKQLQAYLNGQFVNFIGSSAYTFDRQINVGKVDYNQNQRIYVGMDFNVNPMSFILFHTQIVYDDNSNPKMNYLRVFKSMSLPNSNTRKSCEWIKKNYPNKDITFIVDRSGDARKTSADKTDVQIIRQFGFKCNFLTNLSQRDKLNIVNNQLQKGRIIIDQKQGSFLIDDLEAVTLTQLGKINKKDLTLTHQSDALAYSVAWLLRKKKRVDSFAGYAGLM